MKSHHTASLSLCLSVSLSLSLSIAIPKVQRQAEGELVAKPKRSHKLRHKLDIGMKIKDVQRTSQPFQLARANPDWWDSSGSLLYRPATF